MKVKKNDTVVVIAGKDKGKTGKVVQADPKHGKVKVEGVNVQKRHKKPRSAQDVGGIIEQIGAIDVSNVQVVCEKCNVPTRVAMKETEEGKRVRVCKHCGATLDKAKEEKKAAKKTEGKKPAAKKSSAKEGDAKAEKKPATRKPAAKKSAEKPADAE